MITMNRKWMRLMVLVGCAALAASCKQAPAAQTEAEYAVLRVSPSDKVLSTLKSASNLNGNLNCSKELEHYAS